MPAWKLTHRQIQMRLKALRYLSARQACRPKPPLSKTIPHPEYICSANCLSSHNAKFLSSFSAMTLMSYCRTTHKHTHPKQHRRRFTRYLRCFWHLGTLQRALMTCWEKSIWNTWVVGSMVSILLQWIFLIWWLYAVGLPVVKFQKVLSRMWTRYSFLCLIFDETGRFSACFLNDWLFSFFPFEFL